MSDFFKKEQGVASFGYRDVDEKEKPSLVRDLFSEVAPRYDVMNDLMSMGLHRLWKDRMVASFLGYRNRHLLDIAAGTGDIAFRFLEKGGAYATLCDLTPEMIQEGRARNEAKKWRKQLNWVVGDAEDLPFAKGSFDCVGVAFGLRNMTHIDRVLSEVHRVLKTGGRFVCLEFSPPSSGLPSSGLPSSGLPSPGLPSSGLPSSGLPSSGLPSSGLPSSGLPSSGLFARAYDFWSFKIIPSLGKRVSDNEEAYRYLSESIRRFPTAEALSEKMRKAGMARVSYQLLAGGIAALHSAWRF